MTSTYYRPSGRIPAAALPVAVLWSSAALALAWLYALLDAYIRLGFVHILFAIGYAICLGCLAVVTARHAKTRSPFWMGWIGLGIGLVGWYGQWAIFITLIRPEHSAIATLGEMATQPRLLFNSVMELSGAGGHHLGGSGAGNGLLRASWLCELLMFLAAPYYLGRSSAADPFCEASGTWAETLEVPAKFAFIDDAQTAVKSLEHNPGQLLSILKPWRDAGPLSYAMLTLYRCRGASYVSIHNIEAVPKDGKVKETRTMVLEYLTLSGIDVDEIIQLGQEAANMNAADDADPPELIAAIEHLQADRFEAVLEAAAPHAEADELSVRADANRLCALAASRLLKWNQAYAYWAALFKDEPNAHNALQLASTAVMTGNVERGIEWLAKAREMNAISKEVPGLTIQTNFVTSLVESGQMLAAVPYLEEIRQVYMSLGRTDPTFLFAHQLPQLNAFFVNSAAAIHAALGFEEGRVWYQSMLPHLDQGGQAQLNEWLEEGFMQTALAGGAESR